RVDRELRGDLALSQGARTSGAEGGRRRWASRHLGRAGCRLPGGEGAAMLESPPPEPPRQAAAQAARRSAESAHENSVRRDPRGGRAAKANVPDVVHEARPILRPRARSIATGSGW